MNREIRHFVQEQGGYIEFDSGKDHIKIRVEYFLVLIYDTIEENEQKKFLREMKKQLKETNINENDYQSKEEILHDIIKLCGNGFETANNILKKLDPKAALVNMGLKVIQKIIEKERVKS